VLCIEREYSDSARELVIQACSAQDLASHISAALLVILGTWIVDRIMEEDCHFDGVWLLGEMVSQVELTQAVGNVIEVVVATMPLVVTIG
jgi:hypothetical protein